MLICSPSTCRSSAAQPVHTVISQTPSPGSLLRSYRSADILEGKYSLWQSRGCLRSTRNFCMRNGRQLNVKQSALPHPHHLPAPASPALEAAFEHCKVPLLHPSPPMLPRCPPLKRGLSAPAEGIAGNPEHSSSHLSPLGSAALMLACRQPEFNP